MEGFEIIAGNCIDAMRELDENTFHAVVTDPPYAIGLMGEKWDTKGAHEFEAWCLAWGNEAIRVTRPGGHIIAFGGTRTHHRLMSGLEDAGWEIRDCGVWLYRNGQPKAGSLGPKIDAELGLEREVVGYKKGLDYRNTRLGFTSMMHQSGTTLAKDVPITKPASEEAERWEGWSNQLKPAIEPWVLARKPLEGTLAQNILKWDVGGLNIEGTDYNPDDPRFTANVAAHPEEFDEENYRNFLIAGGEVAEFTKAPRHERPFDNDEDIIHPSVKPLSLMRHMVRLVSQRGHKVLEPFAGTGTTAEACLIEGRYCTAIELNEKYLPLIERRLQKPIQIGLL